MSSQTSNTISAHSRITNDSNDKNFTKIITFKTNDEIKLPTSIPFPLSSSNNENHQDYIITSNNNNNNDNDHVEDSNINELGNKIINRLYSLGLISKDINYSSDESDTSSTSWINQENGNIKNHNTPGRNNNRSNNTNNNDNNNDEDEDNEHESNENDSKNVNNDNNNKKKKIYNCKINLEMFRGESKYNVDLYFLYQSKDLFHENSKNEFINSKLLSSSSSSSSPSNEGFMELPPNLYITFEELINYLRDKIFLSGINKNFHGIETKINILLKLKSFKCFINDKEFKLQKKKKRKPNQTLKNRKCVVV